jgi:hypothetical protein
VDDPENEIPRGIAFYPDPENSGQFASEFKLFKDSYNGDGLLTDGDTVLVIKDIKVKDDQNIVEFYNSMANGKVSEELLELIEPIFTWNTKEKTIRMISDGLSWVRGD